MQAEAPEREYAFAGHGVQEVEDVPVEYVFCAHKEVKHVPALEK